MRQLYHPLRPYIHTYFLPLPVHKWPKKKIELGKDFPSSFRLPFSSPATLMFFPYPNPTLPISDKISAALAHAKISAMASGPPRSIQKPDQVYPQPSGMESYDLRCSVLHASQERCIRILHAWMHATTHAYAGRPCVEQMPVRHGTHNQPSPSLSTSSSISSSSTSARSSSSTYKLARESRPRPFCISLTRWYDCDLNSNLNLPANLSHLKHIKSSLLEQYRVSGLANCQPFHFTLYTSRLESCPPLLLPSHVDIPLVHHVSINHSNGCVSSFDRMHIKPLNPVPVIPV